MEVSNALKRSSVLWVTNVASPYRRPVWESLGLAADLTIGLLEPTQYTKKEGRRQADWLEFNPENYAIEQLRSRRVSGGENARFALRPQSGLPQELPDKIVLGGWDQPAYWQLLLRAKRPGKRKHVVGFYESTLLTNHHTKGLIAAARRWFFRQLDAVVVPGQAAREAVLAMGVEPERVFMGFNAVDVKFFHESVARARANLTEDEKFDFIFVGQLIPRKNVNHLLSAIRESATSRALIVGSGPQKDELASTVKFFGMNDRVSLRDPVTNADLPDLLAQARVLVLPSSEEVWGLVVNEALAGGLSVIVSSAAGVARSISGMEGVHVVSPDEHSLVKAVAELTITSPSPIADPEILQHGPMQFAQTFAQALRLDPLFGVS